MILIIQKFLCNSFFFAILVTYSNYVLVGPTILFFVILFIFKSYIFYPFSWFQKRISISDSIL
jgi:hypothetical protein